MGWNPKTWKFNWKSGKERWLVLLAAGLILLILTFPAERREVVTQDRMSGNLSGASGSGSGGGSEQSGEQVGNWSGGSQQGDFVSGTGTSSAGTGGADGESGGRSPAADPDSALAYERQLEERLEELLSRVEGVGNVEVMIVLKSSEESVWRVDKDTSYSSTQESDAGGGTRLVQSQEISEKTILTDQNGSEGPLLEKRLYPEISGVAVIASGGGSPKVQAEISAAVEALFGVPSHKIKVLKRVE